MKIFLVVNTLTMTVTFAREINLMPKKNKKERLF